MARRVDDALRAGGELIEYAGGFVVDVSDGEDLDTVELPAGSPRVTPARTRCAGWSWPSMTWRSRTPPRREALARLAAWQLLPRRTPGASRAELIGARRVIPGDPSSVAGKGFGVIAPL